MKLLLMTVIAVLPYLSGEAQYLYYSSKIECVNASKDVVGEGRDELDNILSEMKREKKVFGYYVDRTEKGNSVFLSFDILAEDQNKFKSIVDEWIGRARGDAFQTFWKSCPNRKDTLVNKAKLMFPVIKDQGSPVAEVPVIDERPDPGMDYKIVYDFTAIPKLADTEKMDSSKVNWGLEEVGRHFNLHAAAGIPKEKIKMIVVIHALGSKSFFNNEEYQKRYKRDNPNLYLINELTKAGVKIVQCGQSAVWMGLKKEMFIPEVKIAMSAKTAISTYQMKGYALLKMNND